MKKIIKKCKSIANSFEILRPFWVFILVLAGTSCRKLVETPPPTSSITEANVFSTDATAISALNNIYIDMNYVGSGNPIQGIRSISLLAGLSSDELSLFSGVTGLEWIHYYQNVLSANLKTGSDQWAPLYNYVFKCNAAIEALTSSKSDGLTQIVKKQLLAEAQFLRGYFYFYLLNLYGDLPLCLTTDPQVNLRLERSPKEIVYQQIIKDLLASEENLSDSYLTGDLLATSTERVRPTKWAAKAFLARIYLFIKEFDKAEEKASEVINHNIIYSLSPSLNDVFLKNSREAIWQLQPTAINFNTQEAITLIIPSGGPNYNVNPVYLSDDLLNNFEIGDRRAIYGNWIDTTIFQISSSPLVIDTVAFAFKYKINSSNADITTSTGTKNMTEYFMLLRLGEQYLIRAEARAWQNKIAEGQSDLNAIRSRAGLPNTNASNQASLVEAILHERRVELFTEGASRWFDLKRTETIDAIMNAITPKKSNSATTWQSYQQLYPIPITELQKAINLSQNSGY